MEKENIQFNKQGLPIKVHSVHMRENGAYRGLHSHPAVEIITVKSGLLHCCVSGENIDVAENQTLFINGNIGHRLTAKSAEITYIQIDISHFKGESAAIYDFISSSLAKPYMLLSGNPQIGGILQKIIRQYSDDRTCSRWYLTAHIYELIAFMYEKAFIALPTSNPDLEKIAPIVRFLEDNYRTAIGLSDISAATGYNKYTVCHLFKDITGKTVLDYINFLRIRCAIEKLKTKNKSILEIATESGFSSSSYFNRVFKNEVGCAPTEYRKYIF